MTKKEISFISYSRSDSEFVLKLAKDLQSRNIHPWVDQLEIKAGSHWDASIQEALIESAHLIVILSPSSAASDNVKDEISFALKKQKPIIPVLLKACEIPYRLDRMQYIDFSVSYQTGLANLLKHFPGLVPISNDSETINTARPVKPITYKQYTLLPGERVIDTWTLNYTGIGSATYNCKVTITTQRILSDFRFIVLGNPTGFSTAITEKAIWRSIKRI